MQNKGQSMQFATCAMSLAHNHNICCCCCCAMLCLKETSKSIKTPPAPANKSARLLVDIDLLAAARGITLRRAAAEANIILFSAAADYYYGDVQGPGTQ